jgi:hypothetical protein
VHEIRRTYQHRFLKFISNPCFLLHVSIPFAKMAIFLSLPAELRNRIYEYTLTDDSPVLLRPGAMDTNIFRIEREDL